MNVIVSFILIQTIVFGIVIFILRKMMIGDTNSAVKRLNDSYSEINKKKEELAKKIQEIEKEYQKRKAEAEKVASELKNKAEEEMGNKRDDMLKKAREEAERIVSDAVSMKEKIRGDLRKEEQLRMVDVCEDILSSSLKEIFIDKIDEDLTGDFLNEFDAMDASRIPANIAEVELIMSRKLSDQLKSKAMEAIHKKVKKEIPIKEKIDQKLLGGVVIKFGSLILDGSLISKLKEIAIERKHLIEAQD